MKKEICYKVLPAKDGSPIIIIQQDERDIAFHSRINPLKEGDTSGNFPDPGRFDMLILLGCGLGYSYMKLKEYLSAYSRIAIIDILPGIENEIAENPHTSFLAKSENIIFLTGRDGEELGTALSELIDFHEIKGVQTVQHPQSLRMFPDYYDEVKILIRKIIDKKAGDKATIRAFGNLFLRNALNNINSFKSCVPVSALEGRFRGRKAVIVSSAPSVEDNIEKLKFYEEDVFIIAVDSAIPLLRSYGIKPDFIISIDPQARIGEHFLGNEFSEALNIFSIVSPPELVRRYGGYISLNSHPVSQVIENMYPCVTGSIDSATGSVAGDAFIFALMAGFEFIAMTGFDFSFSENIIYARETAYQNRYALYFNNRLRTAETFNAEYIFKSSRSFNVDGKYTRRAFIGYKNSLDALIKEKEFKNIYMINRRGLPLDNAQTADFDFFMRLPAVKDENKHESLGRIRNEKISASIDVKSIRDRLLNQNVFDELISESAGSEIITQRRKKIYSMIEGIE